MANVQIIQRHAHLAGAVKLEFVNGREGRLAKAVLTAISNTRRANRGDAGEARAEESTAIQWTLWGKQAENAPAYVFLASAESSYVSGATLNVNGGMVTP